MDTAPRPLRWRRSSFSSNGANCIEISHSLGAVRDSKNPDGPMLSVDLHQLVRSIKLNS